MDDNQKTKKQLIAELKGLRQQIADIENGTSVKSISNNSPKINAERYLNLIETIREGLCVVDEDENVIFVNEPFCHILGYLEEELIGTNLLDLIPDEDRYKVIEATRLKRETGETTRYEIRLKHSAGELRDVLISTSPMFFGSNEYATLGVITDITERKRIERELQNHREHLEELVTERTSELKAANRALQSEIEEKKLAEEALRESEEKYRTFVQDFKGIAYRSDVNFVPMFIHGAVEEITGYTKEEFTSGQPSLDQIVHPEDYAVIAKDIDRIMNSPDSIIEREYRITCKDGTHRWVLEVIQNVCDETGAPIYIHGVIRDITRRKQTEAALLASEDRYRDLVENINDGISSINANGIITYASPVLERIVGFAPNEITGKHIIELVDPQDKGLSDKVFVNMVSGAGPMEADIRFTTKQGAAKWVRITARRAFDQNSELILRCVISDIDKRKAVEEELRVKDAAVESAVSGFVLTDLEGADSLIIYANPSCLKMWGYSKVDEVIGKPISGFYRDKIGLVEVVKSLRDAGSWIGEITGTKKDGSKIPLHLSVNTVNDESGDAVCAILSFVDLSELKEAETALRESEERLNATLNALPDVLFEVDTEGRIYDFRTRFPELLYLPPSEFINKKVEEVLPEETADIIMGTIRKAATNRDLNAVYSLDFPGGKKWFELSITVKGDTDDRGTPENRFIGLARDITERKNTEERLKSSLVEKEILLKEINHRVKNNLNVVASMLSLQSRSIENEPARAALEESKNRIITMANIHNSLYGTDDLANVEFGDYVRQLATRLVSSTASGLDNAKLDFAIDEVKLNVNIAIPCALIINELLSNSLKHGFPSGDPPDISISVLKGEDGLITLSVADKGVGFPPDIDVHNTETLGMQIVNALVTQLDAEIELDRSEGTEFIVKFPEVSS